MCFFAGVKLSNGAGGVSYTPVKDIPQAVCCPSSAGRIFDPFKINGMKVADVLAGLTSIEPVKVSVAIATLNALSACCWDRGLIDPYRIQVDADALDAVRMPDESSIAVIGAFVPILRKLKSRGGKWWVIEQDPKTLKSDELLDVLAAGVPDIAFSTILHLALSSRGNHNLLIAGCFSANRLLPIASTILNEMIKDEL